MTIRESMRNLDAAISAQILDNEKLGNLLSGALMFFVYFGVFCFVMYALTDLYDLFKPMLDKDKK